jgi:hypothetical protein
MLLESSTTGRNRQRVTPPGPSRVDRSLSRLPARWQVPVRRLKWTVSEVTRALLLRRERHYEGSYLVVTRHANKLSARDAHRRLHVVRPALRPTGSSARLPPHDRDRVRGCGWPRPRRTRTGGGLGHALLRRRGRRGRVRQRRRPTRTARRSRSPEHLARRAFAMDEPLLRTHLQSARLEIGWVAETVPAFLASAWDTRSVATTANTSRSPNSAVSIPCGGRHRSTPCATSCRTALAGTRGSTRSSSRISPTTPCTRSTTAWRGERPLARVIARPPAPGVAHERVAATGSGPNRTCRATGAPHGVDGGVPSTLTLREGRRMDVVWWCQACSELIGPSLLVVRVGHTSRGRRSLRTYCSDACAETARDCSEIPVREVAVAWDRPSVSSQGVRALDGA